MGCNSNLMMQNKVEVSFGGGGGSSCCGRKVVLACLRKAFVAAGVRSLLRACLCGGKKCKPSY